MTKKEDEEQLDKMLHDMTGELVRRARSAGATRQQIINALTASLVTLGFEESGSSAAVAAWFRQVAENCQGGNIGALLEFDKISTSGVGDTH